MKIYIVRGEHWYVPGVATSLHWTKATADVKAGELVDQLIADLDDVERSYFVEPASSRWEDRLQAAQLARIMGSEGELSDETRAAIKGEHVFGYDSPSHYFGEISEGDIWIEENDVDEPPLPIVRVTLEGGCVQDISASRPVTVTVVDYDAEEASDDSVIWDIPQDDGTTQAAFVSIWEIGGAQLDQGAEAISALSGIELSRNGVDGEGDEEFALARWIAAYGPDDPADAAIVVARFAYIGEEGCASVPVNPAGLDLPGIFAKAEEAIRWAYMNGEIGKLDMTVQPPVAGRASR